MQKAIGMIFIVGIIFNASAAFAGYNTGFSRAEATWKGMDENGNVVSTITSTWTSPISTDSCGTNCRRYHLKSALVINTDTGYPIYHTSRLYARVTKKGDFGTEPYSFSDWDYINITGTWGNETYSADYQNGSGRNYYSYRNYSSPYLQVSNKDYEVRFDYVYDGSLSGRREFDFHANLI